MPKYKDMGAIPEITKVDLTKKPTEDAIQSEKQKQWLMINKPEIYQKWKNKYGSPKRFLKFKSARRKSRVSIRISRR